jgi:hypothetical protein
MPTSARRKRPVRPAAILTVPINPELKEAIGEAADGERMAMNEWVCRTVAKALGRPDLAAVPRKRFGRPRKEAVA